MVSFISSNIGSVVLPCLRANITCSLHGVAARLECGAAVLRCHDDLTHNVVSSCMPQDAASRAPVRAGCGAGFAGKVAYIFISS
jgi:hypothetical protein